MANSSKYGKITTEHGSIPANEPVFLLRAQDICAIPTLTAYARFLRKVGASTVFRDEIVSVIRAFGEWDSDWKVPD